MRPVKKRKATGLLAELLAEIDPVSLACTRNKMLLAVKIADAMHSKGLNQKQMAAEMQKSESEISEWLSGERNFTVDTLTEIELFLKIKLLDTRKMKVAVSNAPLIISSSKKQETSVCIQNSEWCNINSSISYDKNKLAKAS